MNDLDGIETLQYPVYVYNINEVEIGRAQNKQDFINIWNSDGNNVTIGILSGWYGPFSFVLLLNSGQEAPDFIIGDPNGSEINGIFAPPFSIQFA